MLVIDEADLVLSYGHDEVPYMLFARYMLLFARFLHALCFYLHALYFYLRALCCYLYSICSYLHAIVVHAASETIRFYSLRLYLQDLRSLLGYLPKRHQSMLLSATLRYNGGRKMQMFVSDSSCRSISHVHIIRPLAVLVSQLCSCSPEVEALKALVLHKPAIIKVSIF